MRRKYEENMLRNEMKESSNKISKFILKITNTLNNSNVNFLFKWMIIRVGEEGKEERVAWEGWLHVLDKFNSL